MIFYQRMKLIALVRWMVGGNSLIMWGFLGRIKMMRAYFIKGTWTLCGMGEGGIMRRIKMDCGSFLYIRNIMILHWMWLKEFILGKKCVHVTLEWKETNMQVKCALIITMENVWCVLMALCWCFWFYLENDENTRIVIHTNRII